MLTASCINHPQKEQLLILRQWQIDYCQGDRVAAGLLSILEYWHNVKYNKQSEKPLKKRHINDLIQFHTEKQLIEKLMTVTKTPATLRRSIQFLVEKKVISLHKNPNKRYSFDRTRHFLFHPDVINTWLENEYGGFIENEEEKQDSVQLVDKEAQQEEANKINKERKKLDLSVLLHFLQKAEQEKAKNILLNLQDNSQQQAIINEWQHALKQRNVKNKFSYLAGLVNRSNQGKFHPRESSEAEKTQQVTEVIRISAVPPKAQQPHEIFPVYTEWKQKQAQLFKLVKRADYSSFVLPVRAYASDKMVFLRCPNVYAHTFISNNQDKIEKVIGAEVGIYMG